jgi:formate-dependent nitrite reductase membrane component NrfD
VCLLPVEVCVRLQPQPEEDCVATAQAGGTVLGVLLVGVLLVGVVVVPLVIVSLVLPGEAVEEVEGAPEGGALEVIPMAVPALVCHL